MQTVTNKHVKLITVLYLTVDSVEEMNVESNDMMFCLNCHISNQTYVLCPYRSSDRISGAIYFVVSLL